MSANGQLNRKVKMVREPKFILDMVIPCLKRNKLNRYRITFLNVSTIENTTKQVGSE